MRYSNQKLYEKKMADFLQLGPGTKAVDIGCGRGDGLQRWGETERLWLTNEMNRRLGRATTALVWGFVFCVQCPGLEGFKVIKGAV